MMKHSYSSPHLLVQFRGGAFLQRTNEWLGCPLEWLIIVNINAYVSIMASRAMYHKSSISSRPTSLPLRRPGPADVPRECAHAVHCTHQYQLTSSPRPRELTPPASLVCQRTLRLLSTCPKPIHRISRRAMCPVRWTPAEDSY